MSVTIVIPCHKRHEYLKTVLSSIKNQTALSHVDRILVSENSDDDRSKFICDGFPELNIEYIQQPVEMVGIDHLIWIVNQSKSKYTAMIHDDDWWYSTHLENAIKYLENNDASSYFSNFVITDNEIMKGANFHHPTLWGIFANKIIDDFVVPLNFESVASICYLFTPFHMSGMVAKTEYLKYANENGLKTSKPWYGDRILYPYLASKGTIYLNSQALCAVRRHPGNDQHKYDQSNRYNAHLEGSDKIELFAKENNVNILEVWNKLYLSIPQNDWQEVVNAYLGNFGYENPKILGVLEPIKKNIVKRAIKKLINKINSRI
jgi:glycosyltransferase involved in cell wall biosynthesis